MAIDMTVTGVDVSVSGLSELNNTVLKAAFDGTVLALKEAYGDCHDIISAADHSLKDLARMKHPYGFKHPAFIHSPDETVHTQSHDYIAALKVEKISSYADREIVGGHIGIMGDADMEKLDRWIQLGTPKMRARPWAEYIMDTHGDRYAAIIEDAVVSAIAVEGAA